MKWGCSPGEVLKRCSSRELSELMAFERLEPFGDEWRQIATMIQNLWNTQLKKEDQFKDCEGWIPKPPEPEPDEDEAIDEQEDEDDPEPAQTLNEVMAALAGRGIPVKHGNN